MLAVSAGVVIFFWVLAAGAMLVFVGGVLAMGRDADGDVPSTGSEAQQPDPKWESVLAVENGQVIGFQVRWSQPDSKGRYYWVGHYYASDDASIGWCEVAAEGHARRLNEQLKVPSDFRAFRDLTW